MDFYKHVLIVEFFFLVWFWGYCNVKIKVSIQILYFSLLRFYKNTNSLESPQFIEMEKLINWHYYPT